MTRRTYSFSGVGAMWVLARLWRTQPCAVRESEYMVRRPSPLPAHQAIAWTMARYSPMLLVPPAAGPKWKSSLPVARDTPPVLHGARVAGTCRVHGYAVRVDFREGRIVHHHRRPLEQVEQPRRLVAPGTESRHGGLVIRVALELGSRERGYLLLAILPVVIDARLHACPHHIKLALLGHAFPNFPQS